MLDLDETIHVAYMTGASSIQQLQAKQVPSKSAFKCDH